jgi:hypothetical protein
MPQIYYTPGVCNIGPEEIRRRRNLGWFGIAVALALFALCYGLGLNPLWRLVIFFPAMLSASGFLQAYFHFCSGFARRGIFNFGAIGHTESVSGEASLAKDRKKGNQIALYSALIGVAVALIAVLI